MHALLIDCEAREPDLLRDRVRPYSSSFESEFEAAVAQSSACELVVFRWSPDAVRVCLAIRATRSVPMAALIESRDELVALEAGVDVCFTESTPRVVSNARIDALLRRARRPPFIRSPAMVLDDRGHSVLFDQRRIELTSYEYALLKTLAEHAGQVLSREALMEQAKGSLDASFDRSIDVHMCRLRAKLGDRQRRQRVLRTVKGEGYMLVVEEPSQSG